MAVEIEAETGAGAGAVPRLVLALALEPSSVARLLRVEQTLSRNLVRGTERPEQGRYIL